MPKATSHIFDPTTLREYDIRGVIDETLRNEDAYAIGRSFGSIVKADGGDAVAIAYDGRLSSPMLAQYLSDGLNDAGCDVYSIGLGPTPMLYFAENIFDNVHGGIQITGSHNPSNYNGFKMVFKSRPFFGKDIQKLGSIAAAGQWASGMGQRFDRPIMREYIDRLLLKMPTTPMRVGWDAGNGVAGPIIDELVKRLPGEHFTLYTEVDGRFPNHHPDPTEEHNLADLKKLVTDNSLDFGLAFDGDGDRIGAIDGKGRVIWGDQLLQIYAEQLLRIAPQSPIIADVKASKALFDRVEELGGKPIMWKTGHSLIKSKMKEINAPLAGEMSGHIFFAHDYYGFDDALYAAIMLMRAREDLGMSITQMRSNMVEMANTPEIRFQVEESRKFPIVDEVLDRLSKKGASVDNTDGARVTTDDGWWLLRASNTQDVLVARAESTTQEGLKRLTQQIDEQLALSGISRH